MLWTSKFVYAFADVLKVIRDDESPFILNFPEEIKQETLMKFRDTALDFTNFTKSEESRGMPFDIVLKTLEMNIETVKQIRGGDGEYVAEILEKFRKQEDENGDKNRYFLETFRSLKGKRRCVFGILKDTVEKKIIVVFRGSVSEGTRDWQSNFNAFSASMPTPPLLKDKMKGKLSNRLLMHKGFYEYLFHNEEIVEGPESFDQMLIDIQNVLEDGYSIYVTGHSLGAALSSTASFALAGSDKKWIPKPITCISFASPLTGTKGYRTAFHELEKDGMIRYIRFTNNNDVVPSAPPMGFHGRPYKHVGINIRLHDDKIHMHHSSEKSIIEAGKNSLIKPLWKALDQHSLKLHEARMETSSDDLMKVSIDDLYNDKDLLSSDYFE